MKTTLLRMRMLAAVSGLVLFSCGVAMAQRWLGTIDTNWESGANWEGGAIPINSGTAIFDNAGNNRTTLLLGTKKAVKDLIYFSPACAPYTLGTGVSLRFWLINDGSITLNEDVVNNQVINAYVMIGNASTKNTITFRNHSPVANLSILGRLRYSYYASEPVSVRLEGCGDISFLGGYDTKDALNDTVQGIMYNHSSGRITLGGMNKITKLYNYNSMDVGESHFTINAGAEFFLNYGSNSYSIWHEGNGLIDGPGTLRFGCGPAGEPARLYLKIGSTLTVQALLTSAGGLELYNTANGGGTLVLDCINTMASDLVISSKAGKVSASKIGNRGSMVSNLGQGDRILLTGPDTGLIYTGAGEITDRIIEFSNNVALEHSGSGDLILTEDLIAGAGGKTLTLTGSAVGAGEIAGVIGETGNTTTLLKSGSGDWRLSGSNTYAGKTTIQGGALVLCGANGALASTASITVEGGTLCISNTATDNRPDRVNDVVPIILQGGAIEFAHDSAAATDYSQNFGALTVADYASELRITQAAEGCTSAINFASITHTGKGSLNFIGEGLGEEGNTRSRIFFTSSPALVNGLIPWALVNGNAVISYDEIRGVHAVHTSTNIAARGPDSVIPDNDTLNVQISTAGIEGSITLANPGGASVASLTQASTTPATVAMAGQTLESYALSIVEDGAALTVGQIAGDSTLQIRADYDNFGLVNNSTNSLTINANLIESVYGNGMSKSGKGPVTLNGQLNMGGDIRISGGRLTLAQLAGTTHLIGSRFEMQGGSKTPVTLELQGAAEVVHHGSFYAAINAGDRCIVKVDNDLTIQALSKTEGGRMYVGVGLDAAGAVIQSAGTMSVTTNLSGTAFYTIGGSGGYGYHRLSGGTLTSGEIVVGASTSYGDGNSSVLDLFGGEIIIEGWCVLVGWGRGASALNVFSGAMVSPGSLGTEALILAYNSSARITTQVNMLGPEARMFDSGPYAKKRINMANANGNTLAAFNLNEGELTLHQAYANSTTTPTHFNFNGGLLRAAANGSVMLTGLTAAHVFTGGAHIDTDGYDASLNQGLVAPQGYGAVDIELTSSGAGYIGAPTVLVTGGSGIGATAIALVDLEAGSPSCGQVTNILITSAGVGYAANETLIATLRGGGSLTPATVGAVTLAPNVSGGLTKLGAGALTLSQPCTFTGGTLVEAGTLKFGCDDALLPGSSVALEEGAFLDLNGFTSANVVNGAGVVVNGNLQGGFSPAGEHAIGTQSLSIGSDVVLSGTYTLDVTQQGASDQLVISGNADLSGVQLQVVDLDQLNRKKSYAVASVSGQVQGLFNAGNLPDSKWRLKSANGTILLFFSDGIQLILR